MRKVLWILDDKTDDELYVPATDSMRDCSVTGWGRTVVGPDLKYYCHDHQSLSSSYNPRDHHSRDSHRHDNNWLPRSGDLGGVGTAPPGFHSKGRVSHPGRVSKDSEMKSFLVGFRDWQFGTVVAELCINNSYRAGGSNNSYKLYSLVFLATI